MSEAGWLGSGGLVEMLESLGGQSRPRKFQLFACACLRRLWGSTPALSFRKAVAYAERFAEGRIDREALRAAFIPAWPWGWERLRSAAVAAAAPGGRDFPYWRALETANEAAALLARGACYGGRYKPDGFLKARLAQEGLAREVFCDPSCEGRFLARWRNGEVVRLAETIAEEGAFEDLPVLADALEDAGCEDEKVLRHLRGPREHVLGCWALDLARGV